MNIFIRIAKNRLHNIKEREREKLKTNLSDIHGPSWIGQRRKQPS